MTSKARLLAIIGMLVAGPSFVLNTIAHDGVMPGPDEVDRLDGAFSIMFMVGAAFVMSAILLTKPSPVGRKGRYVLYVVSFMIFMGGVWAAMLAVDPDLIDTNTNPIVLVGDASWPLHQVTMLIAGIVAIRAQIWPAPARHLLVGPFVGLVVLAIGAISGIDYLAASGLGSGWVIAGAGVLLANREPRRSAERPSQAATALPA